MGGLLSRTVVAVFVLVVLVAVARSGDDPAEPGLHALAPVSALPPATHRAAEAAARMASLGTVVAAQSGPLSP